MYRNAVVLESRREEILGQNSRAFWCFGSVTLRRTFGDTCSSYCCSSYWSRQTQNLTHSEGVPKPAKRRFPRIPHSLIFKHPFADWGFVVGCSISMNDLPQAGRGRGHQESSSGLAGKKIKHRPMLTCSCRIRENSSFGSAAGPRRSGEDTRNPAANA